MNKKVLIALILAALIALGLFAYTFLSGMGERVSPTLTQSITLEYWRVFDEDDVLDDVIAEWNQDHPNIKIRVSKKDYTTYKEDLIDAWARGEGPDLFQVQNSWVTEFQGLISPAPVNVQLAYVSSKQRLGGLKTDIVVEGRTTPFYTEQELKRDFVQAVPLDAIREGNIYGIPFSVDTLALFVNDTHLAQASIPVPPTTYDQLILDVPKLTNQSVTGEIIQSGIALGTAKNINRASDILSLLMLQNGTTIMEKNKAKFQQPQKNFFPGLDALRFYSDFSNPAKNVYSWTSTHPQALESFAQGSTSMFFGYAYNIPQIRAQADADFEFSVHPMPQINTEKTTNYANYWMESVAKQSKYPWAGWGFIQFASKEARVRSYLEKTQKPAALKTLIDEQQEDFDLAVFARQALTAQSWYQGYDAVEAEEAFEDMMELVANGNNTETQLQSALEVTAKKIEETYVAP